MNFINSASLLCLECGERWGVRKSRGRGSADDVCSLGRKGVKNCRISNNAIALHQFNSG